MAKILLVEDDLHLSDMVASWLRSDNFLVDTVFDGNDAIQILNQSKYDVIVLDFVLPGRDGPEICRHLRTRGDTTPILMLTSKSQIQDKTIGFRAGTDDYLTKPFDTAELSLRIRALLRRNVVAPDNVLSAAGITLDPVRHKVIRGEEEILLSKKEFSVLEFLMRHQGEVFSADMILSRVWSVEADVSVDTVRTCIKRIRQKLSCEGDSLIRNLHGVGYQLVDNAGK